MNKVSNCCGAYPTGETHDDMAFCSECREHAVFESEEEVMTGDKIEVRTSWCVDDIRFRLGDDVKHMSDKEIQNGLDDLAKGFHEMCVQSGWDVIDNCFKIKENE